MALLKTMRRKEKKEEHEKEVWLVLLLHGLIVAGILKSVLKKV